MDEWIDGWKMDGGWTGWSTDMEDEWMEDGQKIDRRWTEDALMMNGERKKDGRRRD